MRIRKYFIQSLRQILAFVLSVSLWAGALPSAAQTKRRTFSPKKQAEKEEKIDLTDLIQPVGKNIFQKSSIKLM